MSSLKRSDSALTAPHTVFQEVRPWMLMACIVQLIFVSIVAVLGTVQYLKCDSNRFGDWGMLYGGILYACTAVTISTTFGRQRLALLGAIFISSITCMAAMGISGMSYFCFDLREGANRYKDTCRRHISQFNSCTWAGDWMDGVEHYGKDGAEIRLIVLICVVLKFVFDVGIATTAMTEAGQADLCQIEEAMRHFKETNLSYRSRAKQNKFLTKYVSQPMPHEVENPVSKFFRTHFDQLFNIQREAPVEERRIKIKVIMPPEDNKRSDQ